MKAICVDENRNLLLEEIAAPSEPPPTHVNVTIQAAAINHGDKTFLKRPNAAGGARGLRFDTIWGASAAGVVTHIGVDVPARYLGRKVAIYRSLQPDQSFLGLWCEAAQVPYAACLPLPDDVDAKAYSGSLVNVVTAYAFLEQAAAEGHRAVIVTAGGSATGRAIAMLAQRRAVPTIIIVRSQASKARMLQDDRSRILASDDPGFLRDLEDVARNLGATAVFDGVGGALISRMIEALPLRSSIFVYGFLSGPEPVAFHSSLLMMKDLTLRRFSNFDSPTVRDPESLASMLADLEGCIKSPAFWTTIGQEFSLSDFASAMDFEGSDGRKAVFVPTG